MQDRCDLHTQIHNTETLPTLQPGAQRFWLINKTIYWGSARPVSDTVAGWRDPSSRCRPIRALSIMIEHSSVSDTFTCPPLLFKENAEAVLIYISHISSLHLYTCSTVSQVVALHLFVLFHYFCCFNGKPGPWVRSFVSPHVNMRMTTKLSWITDILSRTFGIILHMRAGSTPADSLHSYSGPVLTFSPLVKTIKSS